MLVQRLKAIQDDYGYLPDAELHALAKETKTPLYRIQEVVSFFPHFRAEWNKPPRVLVQVCRDMSCHLKGAKALTEQLKKVDGAVVEGVSCLGRCDRPVATCISRHGDDHFHDHIYAGREPRDVERIVREIVSGQTPVADLDANWSIDRTDWEIDPYSKNEFEPYDAVRQFLKAHPTPIPPPSNDDDAEKYTEANHPWLKKLQASGLVGMGGAGMPAFLKWGGVWKASPTDGSNEKYIVINGDESEPATFKDREILLHLPHIVVEGVILAGLMANATHGYIYIRHEYEEQIEAVRAEILRAESLGACGKNIFGTTRSYPVEVFVSPGGYICGEQSALIEAMEDRRAQPRNKPPELLTNGLRDRPTVVNNVETIAWAPAIMLRGPKWYSQEWRPGFRGRRLFSVCGDLNQPGVHEVPNGITLGELIDKCGGMKDGKPLKAVALSGPSGGLIPARVPLADGFDKRFAKALERFDTDLAKRVEDLKKKEKDNDQLPKLLSDAKDRSDKDKGKFEKLVKGILVDGKYFDARKLPLDKGSLGMLAGLGGVDFMLGAGMAVYAEPCDILDQAVRFTEFFRNESCGKCVPCRIGSQKLAEIGSELIAKRDRKESISLDLVKGDVLELNRTLGVTSICGLGQVAGSPLATALVYFADEIAGKAKG